MNPSDLLRRASDIYEADEEQTAEEAINLAWVEWLRTRGVSGTSMTRGSNAEEEEFLFATLGYLREATLKTRLFDRAVALAEAEE